jgi:hypothetical protein
MPGLLRAAVLLVAIASCASTAVRAEELGLESPWSRAAIAHAAEVDLFGHAAESDSAMLVRTFREQTQPDKVIAHGDSEVDMAPVLRPRTGSIRVGRDVLLPIVGIAAMEAVLGSMTYAVIRQENGGYYWGGYMLFMSLCAPAFAEGGADPMLFESLLTLGLAFAAVGAYDIAAEKRGEDRTRMFQRTFVGMNVGFVAPMVVEGVSRFLRSRF